MTQKKIKLKTINNETLLGTGDIEIDVDVDSSWIANSENPVQSKLVKSALDNKLDKTHTSYKGKNVVTNSSTGAIEFEEKNNHTHTQYLTEHQSLTNYVTTSDSRLSDARTPLSHSHGNLQNNGQVGSTAQANKNVVTNSSGLITTEDKPTIPSASSTTPSADTTSGSVGTGTTWARSNHTHPKSSIYAEASHTHTKSQITDFPTTFENGAVYVEGTNADTETTTNTFKATLPLSSSEIVDGLKLVYKVSVTSTNNTSDLRFQLRLSNSTQETYVRVNNALTTANLYPRNTLIYFVRLNGFWHIVGLSSLENSNNKVTSWSGTPTDLHYPSEKLVKDGLDSKEDNIEIFDGSVVRTSATSAFLKAYTSSSILVGKIILYKVPNISSIEWATNVALDYYTNNQTSTFNRKYVYKNGVQLTFGDIESNSWLLLAYEGTISNGQWNLISSSSYVETKNLPTSTSDLTGDYLQTQQGDEVFRVIGVSDNEIGYGNQALTFNITNNKFYYNKLEGSGEIATVYDLNKETIKNFSNNDLTIINKHYDTSKEVKFHYSRTSTTDCDGYIQIGDDDYGIIVGIVEAESINVTLQDNLSGDMYTYYLTDVDDSNSFDISLRLELDTQDIESLQLGDEFHYFLILTIDGIFERTFSAEPTITQSDDVDIFLDRNYISKVVQDTNSRITDLTYSTDGVYVEKADLNNNSTNLDSLLADMIDYGMDNDSEW